MRPVVKVSYQAKFDAVGDTEPADIMTPLKENLPDIAFSGYPDFVENTKKLSLENTWKPAGELHATMQDGSHTYEIWKGTLVDPGIKQLVARIQLLPLLFIEGGSPIINPKFDAVDDRWTVWSLYEKDEDGYSFLGFSTVYRFYYFGKRIDPPPPPGTQFELPVGDFDLGQLPSRARLSQFLILKPYQSRGLGTRLYKTMFQYYYDNPLTRQLTVEEPNESFDDLRDMCDLAFLLTLPEFRDMSFKQGIKLDMKGLLPELVDRKAVDALMEKSKIVPRQFMRCLEMHLMSKLPESVRPRLPTEGKSKNKPTADDKFIFNVWRLFVKSRLLVHNVDVLGQYDLGPRLVLLEETMDNVQFDYIRLLNKFQRRAQRDKPKRRLDDDDTEDASASKKAKVEDVEEDGTSI